MIRCMRNEAVRHQLALYMEEKFVKQISLNLLPTGYFVNLGLFCKVDGSSFGHFGSV